MSVKPETYFSVAQIANYELLDKKSRFIGACAPVKTVTEAQEFIALAKTKYPDARHHCYAWIVQEEQRMERFSDDGEPQGTGGKPILDCLQHAKLINVAVVVTRYFGGILLGTGGLTRAYGGCANETISRAGIVCYRLMRIYTVSCSYNLAEKVRFQLQKRGIWQEEATYLQEVSWQIALPETQEEEITTVIADLTAGQAKLIKGDLQYMASYN